MNSFAKLVGMFSAVFCLSASAWADYGGGYYPNQPNILGEWQVVSRSCSSGMPVRDGFVPGRDTVEISFREDSFRTFTDVAGCVVNSSGYYEQNGHYLTLDIRKQTSTCRGNLFNARMTYRYAVRGNQLRVDMGPVDGGACPYGDIFSVYYSRL